MSDKRPPVTVETTPEGATRTEVDAVSPREMHAHLSHVYKEIHDSEDRVYEKLEAVDGRLGDVRVDFEKRLGRMEKLLLLLAALVASPKFGGPDVQHLAQAAVAFLQS